MAVRTIAGAAFATGVATALLGSLGQAEVFDDLRWPMLFIPLGVLAMVFWVTMLIDCAIKEPRAGNDKVVWVIIIVFTQLIGAAIYLFVRRPQRVQKVKPGNKRPITIGDVIGREQTGLGFRLE